MTARNVVMNSRARQKLIKFAGSKMGNKTNTPWAFIAQF